MRKTTELNMVWARIAVQHFVECISCCMCACKCCSKSQRQNLLKKKRNILQQLQLKIVIEYQQFIEVNNLQIHD